MSVEDSVAQDQIKAFVERVERLDEELKAINDDKKEIFAEARGNGFDVPALKQVIKLRRQDANERMEREAIVELYMAALGMIAAPDFDEPRVQVQARVREATQSATPEHDAETGKITEPQEAQAPAQAQPETDSLGAAISLPGAEGATDRDTIQPETVASSAEPARASVGGNEEAQADLPATHEEFPPCPMKRTPYAHCFPEVLGAAYEQLGDDIAANGVQRAIVRMGDVIVDGWARYNISRALGTSYPVEPYSGNDVLLDVIAWQRRDRQFTPAQERQIATKLAKEVPHRADDIMAAFGLAEELAAAE